MDIVLKRYTNKNGLIATISISKDCKSFFLDISKPITDNPCFATTVYKNCFASIAAAKTAIKRFDNTFTEDK